MIQVVAPFVYDPKMTLHAKAMLAILNSTEVNDNTVGAIYNREANNWEYYAETSVYYNCRENGFVLAVAKHHVASNKVLFIYVADIRNSDGYFVETWTEKYFGINPPSQSRPDEAYQNRRTFPELDFNSGLEHILQLIKLHLKES